MITVRDTLGRKLWMFPSISLELFFQYLNILSGGSRSLALKKYKSDRLKT